MQRTKSLLFTKLEKLLDQNNGEFDDTKSYKAMDPSLARKAEELSTYIDRVEEQIQRLKNEGANKSPSKELRRADDRAN